jgi:hypothetical protein
MGTQQVCKECLKFLNTKSRTRSKALIECGQCQDKVHNADSCRRLLGDGLYYCLGCSEGVALRLQADGRERATEDRRKHAVCIKCKESHSEPVDPKLECSNLHARLKVHYQHYSCVSKENPKRLKGLPTPPVCIVREAYEFNCDVCVGEANLCTVFRCVQEHATSLSKLIECRNCEGVFHFDCIGLTTENDLEGSWPCPTCLKEGCEDDDGDHRLAIGTNDGAGEYHNDDEADVDNGEPIAADADGEYNPAQERRISRSQPRSGPNTAANVTGANPRRIARSKMERARLELKTWAALPQIDELPALQHHHFRATDLCNNTGLSHLTGALAETAIIGAEAAT